MTKIVINPVRKPGFTLAWISTLFTLAVVLLGAYTRLSDAGLGCPDWPGCYGFASVPRGDAQIDLAESRYPHAPVEAHKAWPEMVHRYFAGTLGFLILANGWVAWLHRHQQKQPLKLPFLLVALVVMQGLFGMWTVTLKLWPQVVTLHLLGGFATLALLWLLTLRLSGWDRRTENMTNTLRSRHPARLARVGLFLLVVQIALGGWTSSNYAALACPDLPTCQTQWWPEMDFHAGFNLMQDVGPSYLGGLLHNSARMAVHVTHRLGALVVTAALLLLAIGLLRYPGKQRWLGSLLLLVLMLQVSLGVGNILLQLPLSIAVAHNGVAALLLLVVTTINYFGMRSDCAGRLS